MGKDEPPHYGQCGHLYRRVVPKGEETIIEKQVFTVDSIHCGFAAMETKEGRRFHIPSSWLPPETNEGDVLELHARSEEKGRSRLEFLLDNSATQARRERIKGKLDSLRKRREE
ncbi:MAG: DUF3006 domain-containing protein [Spirochaetaceae bacterium]